ncbi:MAG TPA: nitrate reductase molybdenum cofactor assembly chaperone [Casimicrobiaceae bacterium]|nr:nitrate reductase molybdenum cofactor assembly chaperone [Casimicrobiaceae bacterium]
MKSETGLARSLRLLARLIAYPDQASLPLLRDALEEDRTIPRTRRVELARLVDWLLDLDALDAEACYVALFDRGRAASLHLFEHVHSDSRERGPAMIDLVKTYEAAGLYLAPGEMPDYLPAFLEFASTQPPREARASLAEIAHILNRIMSALVDRNSPYASAIGALLDLAGEKARAVKLAPEEPIDATWEEPPAFAGCSSHGQARPDAPQPIQFVR